MSQLESRIQELEERVTAHEIGLQALLPETDVLRILAIATIVTIATVLSDWPAHISRIEEVAGAMLEELTYGSPAATQLLKPRAFDIAAEVSRRVSEVLLQHARQGCAGEA